MCDQTPLKTCDDTSVVEPRRLTVDHLRRAAESCRDLTDPVLMAKAWDEPAKPEVQPATNSPRRLSQLEHLSVLDNFDDSLT